MSLNENVLNEEDKNGVERVDVVKAAGLVKLKPNCQFLNDLKQ